MNNTNAAATMKSIGFKKSACSRMSAGQSTHDDLTAIIDCCDMIIANITGHIKTDVAKLRVLASKTRRAMQS